MFGNTPIQLLGATLTPQVIVVMAFLVLVTAGLSWFFNYTLFGKALRASAVNPTGAKLMGIDISRFRLFCFGLAGGLGALTGIVTAPITFTGYEIGLLNGLKGLVAAIVGGWTIIGTVLAALALGLLEGFCAGFISASLKDVFSLLVMVVFLVLSTYRLSFRRKIAMKPDHADFPLPFLVIGPGRFPAAPGRLRLLRHRGHVFCRHVRGTGPGERRAVGAGRHLLPGPSHLVRASAPT